LIETCNLQPVTFNCEMIEIDGSAGEGGGQVVRSSLALAVMTGQPVHIANVRARREKPGLQPQHLAAVRAAAQISGAYVEGAAIGSADLVFQPAGVFPGHYRFDIGTAGSTSLVLQTVFLPLALAHGATQPAAESTLMLIGGTHVPWSPCFHYLDLHWLSFMARLGCDADLEMLLAGFFPQGQGQVRATIRATNRLASLDLPERGALKAIRGISGVANLDMTIAERQRKQAMQRLQGRHGKIEIECIDMPARTKGTFLLLLAEFRHSTACYFSLGALGKRAEQVADEACLWLEKFLAGTGAVDEHLGDQLLLPLAFADSESRFRTARVTQHLLTHADVIRAFGVAEIVIEEDAKGVGLVRVMPRG
jgi:RNA 3'-terminal phosphate cyclase (ATP)